MWNVPDIVLSVWFKAMSNTKNILEIMELPFFFLLFVHSPIHLFIYDIYVWITVYQNSENITVTEGKKDLVFTYVHCISSFLK